MTLRFMSNHVLVQQSHQRGRGPRPSRHMPLEGSVHYQESKQASALLASCTNISINANMEESTEKAPHRILNPGDVNTGNTVRRTGHSLLSTDGTKVSFT